MYSVAYKIISRVRLHTQYNFVLADIEKKAEKYTSNKMWTLYIFTEIEKGFFFLEGLKLRENGISKKNMIIIFKIEVMNYKHQIIVHIFFQF